MATSLKTVDKTQPQIPAVAKLVSAARRALEAGNREGAYSLSLEATRQDPGSVEAWLIRARTSASTEERLFSLSQVSRINPDHPAARKALYSTLWSELEQDPFLAYIDETDKVYYVRSNDYLSLAVPKDRNIPESYPPKRPPILARAYRWLGWSVVGLALAGLGALIFAPAAIRLAASTLDQPLPHPDRIRAGLIMALATLVSAVAIFLAWLLLAHLAR